MADPIPSEHRAAMNELAHLIDAYLNGPKTPGIPPTLGFVLLVAKFGEISDGRVNYISNGRRADMISMVREYLARLEGRAHDAPGRAQ